MPFWEERTERACTLLQKKVVLSVWWSAAGLIHYSFLNPSEAITSEKYAQQIDEMHKKIAMPTASTGQPIGPSSSLTMLDHMLCNQCFKSWASWAMKFCLICRILLTSHQSTNTTSKYLDNFLHGKCFHNQQDSENHFQEGVKSQSMGFYITEINKLISCWHKYVVYNGSYFDQ